MSLSVAIAGLGTVGTDVVRILQQKSAHLAQKGGCEIHITAVSARDRQKNRSLDLNNIDWFNDSEEMARKTDADLVVELIGGANGVARNIAETALKHGKHFVTANKALIAEHGFELARLAEKNEVVLACEAAVAGGIPILKMLREGLAANHISSLYGILNGTCNYILTQMQETGADFDTILTEAQRLGYAESDPSFDVDGIDTAHKLAILSALAFGTVPDFSSISIEGMRHISPLDLLYAKELGFCIKLLGMAHLEEDSLSQTVYPCLIPNTISLSHVSNSFNAVTIKGDFVGEVTAIGRGAGGGPTASAVVADILDIARGHSTDCFGVPTKTLKKTNAFSLQHREGAYYLRLTVADQPGVMADISRILSDHDVSLDVVLQKQHEEKTAPLILTTHKIAESKFLEAVQEITALKAVLTEPQILRIEPLGHL